MNIGQIMILCILDTISICLFLSKLDSKVLENKIKLSILIPMMVCISAVYTYFNLPMRVPILACFMIMLLTLLFGMPLLQAIFNYLLTITSILIIQVIVMLFIQVIHRDAYSFINGLIVNGVSIISSFFIYKYVPIDKLEIIYIKQKNTINNLILLIIIPLMIYTIIWDADRTLGWKYIPLIFSGVIIWTLIVVIVFLEVIKITDRRKSVKIYEEYNPLLENLMEELRAKQHDIKNHLQTIYGIAQEHKDEEIITYIDGLIQSFPQKEKYILTGNIVISTVIYTKMNKANSKYIPFEFHHESPIPAYPLKEYEITEVLSNIIDNAIEASEQAKEEEKKIIINLKHEENYKVMEILNTGEYPKYLDSIFNIGFSTKGIKRGYGLYNVEKIVKSYRGFIEVSHSDNLTCFKLMFP